MPVTIVIGAQWGDEGKGRIVDYLAQDADMVIRFNGGPNAGHTVHNEFGKFKLHHIPAGIFNPGIICIIGNGVVIDPDSFLKELLELQSRGISTENLKISSRAHLVMPWHIMLDKAEEEFRGKVGAIGTTLRGVGPAFSDKMARNGVRVGNLDLLETAEFQKRLRLIWQEKSDILWKVYGKHGKHGLGYFEQILDWLRACKVFLAPFIADTEFLIWEAVRKSRRIILEGAQGALLDVDFGTYPNVTSSACGAAGALQGSGIPPNRAARVIGVAKAYTTRVGSGPFPTEMAEDLSHALRYQANEFGATTGRPRRIGWFDAMLVRYAARVNGFIELALTRLDSLAGISPLKICKGYRGPRSFVMAAESDRSFHIADLDLYEPIYEELEGWDKLPSVINDISDFPIQVRRYIKLIEALVGVPVNYVSYGPERKQMLKVSS